ncbi:MAG: TrkH family potassium uptake protein [Alphaproteobacteria bacterium]
MGLRMINWRAVLMVNGVLSLILAAFMLIPLSLDLIDGHPAWQSFASAMFTTVFVGVGTLLTTWHKADRMSVRDAFLITTSAWVVIAGFAALPFYFGNFHAAETGYWMDFTDAFFESMSGITTTGATIVIDLESMSRGMLLWRSLLQWLGGIGIIVMAVSVLPMLQIGGMQLFKVEGFETEGKALPKAVDMATGIVAIYTALTMICLLSYVAAGMTGFDAVAHAMTTIATGGYSTKNASIGHFEMPMVPYVATTFMLLSSLPFIQYVKVINNWSLKALFQDRQVQTFLIIAALAIVSATAYLTLNATSCGDYFRPSASWSLTVEQNCPVTWELWATGRELTGDQSLLPPGIGVEEAFRLAAFNVVSLLTGTGYASDNYELWGPAATAFFFIIMFVGGCAGSTTCGIKVFRFMVLWQATKVQLKRLLQPNGVFLPYYNGRRIPPDIPISVLSFFFMFAASFALLALVLMMLGLDFLTAWSGAGSAIANVGPGLGEIIGPTGNFEPLPQAAKWVLCAGMLLGRLELFCVMVLLLPSFWRR